MSLFLEYRCYEQASGKCAAERVWSLKTPSAKEKKCQTVNDSLPCRNEEKSEKGRCRLSKLPLPFAMCIEKCEEGSANGQPLRCCRVLLFH